MSARGCLLLCLAGSGLVATGMPAAQTSSDAALDAALGLALPSVLQLAGGIDSDGGRDARIDLDIGLTGGERLLLALGQRQSDDDGAALEPRTLEIGLASDPLDRTSLTLSWEEWGQDDAVTTRTLRGRIAWSLGDWRLSLAPSMRTIRIFFAAPVSRLDLGDDIEIGSQGLALGAGVYLGSRLYLAGDYFSNEYTSDPPPSALQNAPAAIISDATLSLASGLEKRGGGMVLRLAQAWGIVGLRWAQSVSAVDEALTRSLSASIEIELTPTLTGILGVGQQTTDGEDDLDFVDTALLLSW